MGESKAIVGRMSCGHVVAIDLDPSAKTRRRLALFRAEAEAHWDRCKGQRKD